MCTAWLIPSLIAARTSGGLERLSAGPSEPSLSIVYETTSSISASTAADRGGQRCSAAVLRRQRCTEVQAG